MIFTTEQISEIKSKAMAATEQLRSEFLPIEEQRKKKEEALAAAKAAAKAAAEIEREQNPVSKEVLVVEAIKKIPICDDAQASIAELVKIITGLNVSIPDSVEAPVEKLDRAHIPLSMIVPTKNQNGHNYPVNVPVMMICDINDRDHDNGIQIGGIRGNHLEWGLSGLRPATNNEIDMFFKIWENLSEMRVPLCEGYDILGTEKKDGDK